MKTPRDLSGATGEGVAKAGLRDHTSNGFASARHYSGRRRAPRGHSQSQPNKNRDIEEHSAKRGRTSSHGGFRIADLARHLGLARELRSIHVHFGRVVVRLDVQMGRTVWLPKTAPIW